MLHFPYLFTVYRKENPKSCSFSTYCQTVQWLAIVGALNLNVLFPFQMSHVSCGYHVTHSQSKHLKLSQI